MTAPFERHPDDDRLDRLIVAALNDRADDVAAAVLPAEAISERIRQRASASTQQTLRAVAGLVAVAVVVLAAAAAALVGMRPPSPSPGPPTDASPSLAGLETLNPDLAPRPILVDLLPDACFFGIHVPVRQALNTLVITESGTPPEAPRGGVCQLWNNRAHDADDYLGNIHVYERPTDDRIPIRVRTLVGADATVVRGFGPTPVYVTTCAVLECNNAVLVVHERYMVLVLLQDRALDTGTAMQTLEQIAVGIVALLNEEG